MVRIAGNRRTPIVDPSIGAGIDLAQTIIGELDEWDTKIRNSEIKKEENNASVASLEGFGAIDKKLRDAANRPDLWEAIVEGEKKSLRKAVLNGTTYKESREAVSAGFDLKFAGYLERTKAAADIQVMKNADTDFGVGEEKLKQNIDLDDPLDVAARLQEGDTYYDNGFAGGVSKLPTPKARDEAKNDFRKDIAGKFIVNTGEYIDNPNKFFEENTLYDTRFTNDEIAKIKKSYETAQNNAERKAKEEHDLQNREMQSNLWKHQKAGTLTVEMMNDPAVEEFLTVPEQRTFWNSLNNTKTYTPEQKSKAHSEGIQAMVDWRGGKTNYEDTKKIIDKLNSDGAIDPVDGQAWIEELLGFKKPTQSQSTSATSMGYAGMERLRKAQLAFAKSQAPGDLEALAKIENQWDLRIINQDAVLKAHPDWTEREINKSFGDALEAEKEVLAKEVVKRTSFLGRFTTPPPFGQFGGPGRDRLIPKKENPFKKDYPDAFKDGDSWYVIRDGKRFRIKG